MRILSTLLFLLFAMTTFGQSISELEAELKATSDDDRIMNIKYDLAELYKNKDKKKAASYALDSYSLARKAKDKDMMILASYLDAEIQLAKKDINKAISRFKASLKHSIAAGDKEFTIENLKQLEALETEQGDFEDALTYSKEVNELLAKDKVTPRSYSQTTGSTSRQTNNSNNDYVTIIRNLKVDLADLKEENDNLLSKLERIGNNEMTATELKAEMEREKSQQASERESALQQLDETERKLAQAAEQVRKEKNKANSILTDFNKLSKEAQEDKILVQEAKNEALQFKNSLYLLGLASLFILFLATIFYNRFRINKKAKNALQETNRQIEEERKMSDELLLNILPSPIAKELKENGKASAEKFENVTVLFTDFKDFTKISERLTPEQLVRELDYCFRGFDFILSQYNVEKIKTIGDAYMCASGLTKTKTLPINIVKAALEMQEFLEDYKKERMVKSLPFFEARIGIHTGPVVAGVVGVKKFAYDIWGDTVNIAARMEANCEVGKVNISESTYRQVKYNFECDHRGKIDAKNKGFIDMYYVKQPVGQLVKS